LSYKVVNPVKIDGVIHQAGELVLLETVERWSKTHEDSGTPPPERDSDRRNIEIAETQIMLIVTYIRLRWQTRTCTGAGAVKTRV
jgi:hypothetical protein